MAISAVVDYVVTITVDDTKPVGQQITVDRDPFATVPDKHIIFLIQNNGAKKRKVSIDRHKMQKRQEPSNAPGPDTPIEFELFGRDSDHVDPGDVGVIVLHVKDKDEFGGAPAARFYKYKYTVEASGLPDLDPDIDINN